jgi:hypothetical protein
MVKALLLSTAALSLWISSPRCIAQELVPVIYLSTDEAAKTNQTAQDLKSALDRNNRAIVAWGGFNQSFQAAHPEMPGLRFSSDLRVAFAKKNVTNSFPFETEAATVELSAEERKKAESLHQEMLEAKRLLEQSQKKWLDCQNQLVLDHVPPNPKAGGAVVILPNGQTATIPYPWANGVVFTPDFRVAVPR